MTPVAALLITVVLLVASVTDLRDRVVPNRLTLGAAAAGLALAGFQGLPELAARLAAGVFVAAPLLAVSLARPEGLGMGDVKLVSVLGIFMGWQAVPAMLGGCLLAAMAGALFSLGSRRPPSEVALPLVPFLAIGSLPVVLAAL
jgi:leader peptidase (prepilin peptidase)/N-methyltransferase